MVGEFRFKRMFKRAGYQGTVNALLDNKKKFVRGLQGNAQMLELLCQFAICKDANGYSEMLCHQSAKCMGVPYCSKKDDSKAIPLHAKARSILA